MRIVKLITDYANFQGDTMTLILYAPRFDEFGRELKKALESEVEDADLETYEGLHNLTGRLRRPVEDPAIVVILAGGLDDLQELMSVEWLLKRVRIMLVLEESDAETLKVAHRLRPRYLGYREDDVHTIPAVTNNMIQGFIHRTSTQRR